MGDMEREGGVMKEKTKLKGRRDKIEEYLTWMELMMLWKLQKIA